MSRRLEVYRLGTVPYEESHSLQARLVEARTRNDIPDTLLLLQHPPVITLGRGSKAEHVLMSPEALAERGVEHHAIGRGGDVTYHGPGQIVGYAIIDLKPDRCDVRRYVRDLEETMIRTSLRFGIEATRIPGLNGAWVDHRKIGAVGVRISRWVTMHGFAFNVSTDLSAYSMIVPCGIHDKQVTSLEREVGRSLPIDEVETVVAYELAQLFDAECRFADNDSLATA